MTYSLNGRSRLRDINALLLTAVICTSLTVSVNAQSAEQDWEKEAGGKQSFEVATIKLADELHPIQPNVSLNIDNEPTPPGGHFLARGTLPELMDFAYKVMPTRSQEQTMLTALPKWVATQSFVVEAKFPTASPRDQLRLMTQDLIANRFHLRLHFETREAPVLAMELVKPGKPGSRIRPHSEGLPCDAKWTAPPDLFSQSAAPGSFLPVCGSEALLLGPHQTVLVGGRDVTLREIAQHIPMWQDFGRPIVDRTGLAGTYDFSLFSTPNDINSAAPPDSAQLNVGAPGFTQALREQLGVKFKPTKAPLQVIVVDHIEQPSAN